MNIDTEDHGGVAVMLRNLQPVYGLEKLEDVLARAVQIALKLSQHADPLGHVRLLDRGRRPQQVVYVH